MCCWWRPWCVVCVAWAVCVLVPASFGELTGVGQILLAASTELFIPERIAMTVDVAGRTVGRDGSTLRRHRVVVFRRNGALLDVRDVADPGERVHRDVRRLWDGSMFWELASNPRPLPDQLTLGASPEMIHGMLWEPAALGLGVLLPGDSLPFHQILRGAQSLSVERDKERVGDAYCFHISAASPGYQYDLWLDPGHNFLPRRIEMALQAPPAPIAADYAALPATALPAFRYTLDRVVVEETDNGFLIGEAQETTVLLFPDGARETSTTSYRRRNIMVDTDFAGMGAFQINVPEGTIVNGAYVWKKGGLERVVAGAEIQRASEALNVLFATAPPGSIELTPSKPQPPAQAVPVSTPYVRNPWLEAVALMAACLVVVISLYVFFHTRRRPSRHVPRIIKDNDRR